MFVNHVQHHAQMHKIMAILSPLNGKKGGGGDGDAASSNALTVN